MSIRFDIVGNNQYWTKGVGVESYVVPEYDWITVKPGDVIGVWEPRSNRAEISYTPCS